MNSIEKRLTRLEKRYDDEILQERENKLIKHSAYILLFFALAKSIISGASDLLIFVIQIGKSVLHVIY